MKQYHIIGRETHNVDGFAKATGQALYTSDILLPRMLYGKILRSPYPHARILNIDTSKAEKLPGVKTVIAAEDTGEHKQGCWRRYRELCDEPVLCLDKVRYIGDPVAAVAAVDEDTAEEALNWIKVDYELLPAVFEPIEAMKEGAPLIHDGVKNNVNVTRHIEWGDVDEAFKDAEYIREDEFTLPAQSHVPMETHCTVASFDGGSNRLTVWTSTQCPYYVQCLLAETLEMKEGDVRIIKPHVGGGFGGKNELFADQFCSAFLSRKTGRPVKIVLSREEDFYATRRRTPLHCYLKLGAKRDGTLLAKEVKVFADGGAYTSMGATCLYLTGWFSAFPYKYPNYRYDGYKVYTNKNPSSSMRGFGAVQAVFAGEQQIDMLAEDLGLDPIEIRQKNAMTPGYVIPGQATIGSCGLPQALNKIEEVIEERGKLPANRGIGIASYGYNTGGVFNWFNTPYAFSAAEVRINIDGMVDLYTLAADIGQGANTTMCMIAAEELGVCLEDIRLHTGDTDICPSDLGAWASRETLMMGNAVKMAALDAKRQLFEVAAVKLSPNIIYDFEAKDRRIYFKDRPEKGLSYYEVVKNAIRGKGGVCVVGRGHYTPHGKGMIAPAFSFGVQAIEVEVDEETGHVKVIKVTTAHDCGQAINPLAVEGQIEGSISMGMGYGLYEELLTEEGKVVNADLTGYKLVTTLDMPETESFIVETYEPEGPFGAKEAGEGLTCPTAGALANAIYHAVGVRIKDAPITPEKILKALKEKGRDGK